MTQWPRLLGIVGGLGPFAHLVLERRLLDATADVLGRPVEKEQDYPPWLLSSLPATPDRTAALLEGAASPEETLVTSLLRLQGRADFAVIACNTAHAFLDAIRPRVEIPILDMVDLTVAELARRGGEGIRVGLLGTSGTLRSELFPRAARQAGRALSWITPLDLEHGQERQETVMQAIFALKAGEAPSHFRQGLLEVARDLQLAGASTVVLGCTEVSLALGGIADDLVDPLQLVAVEALRIAAGQRPLPS